MTLHGIPCSWAKDATWGVYGGCEQGCEGWCFPDALKPIVVVGFDDTVIGTPLINRHTLWSVITFLDLCIKGNDFADSKYKY